MTDLNVEHLTRLTKDLKQASTTLSSMEARFLVDAYYLMQDDRKRSDNQVRALNESEEPHSVLTWLADNSRMMENQIKRALDSYSDSQPIGQWARKQMGIGPVIAAGLMAHIDITKAPTAGHIWRFAGLDPTSEWKKGEKRPFNAALKVLCWKIGESFVKISGNEEGFYGHIYLKRKEYENAKNDAGEYVDQAKAKLEKFKIGKTTEAYKHYSIGKLPPGHIHARAKRYAVKLFLSHYHDQLYRLHYGTEPPLPYPIAHLGHVHMITAPT